MKEYPAPLPGRRFWVERAVADTPGVVVARILEDGPTPMGPIVYLKSVSRDVSTVICRCMNAQASEVVGTSTYRLATLDDVAVQRLRRHRTPGVNRWLPKMPADDPAQWLRGHLH